jgi:hypothetical protein
LGCSTLTGKILIHYFWIKSISSCLTTKITQINTMYKMTHICCQTWLHKPDCLAEADKQTLKKCIYTYFQACTLTYIK